VHHASVSFEIVAGCEQKCAHCYNVWKGPDAEPTGRISTASYKEVMTKALVGSRTRRAVLTGGEPTNHPDFLALAAHARSLVPRLGIITNGNRLESLAPSLGRLGTTSVQVTLLAAHAGRHDELKGDTGSFERTIRGAVACFEQNVEVVVCFVCTPENWQEFPGVLEIAAALGVRMVSFNRASPSGWGVTRLPQIVAEPAMVIAGLEAAERAYRTWGIRTKAAIPIPPCVVEYERYPSVELGFCGVGRGGQEFAIDPAGKVRSCNLSSTRMADLCTDEWTDAEASPYLRQFVAALPEECVGCRHAKTCGGGCKEGGFAAYGKLGAVDPFVRLARTGSAATTDAHSSDIKPRRRLPVLASA